MLRSVKRRVPAGKISVYAPHSKESPITTPVEIDSKIYGALWQSFGEAALKEKFDWEVLEMEKKELEACLHGTQAATAFSMEGLTTEK